MNMLTAPYMIKKEKKQLKIITIWKNYGEITILNYDLCELYKLGWDQCHAINFP